MISPFLAEFDAHKSRAIVWATSDIHITVDSEFLRIVRGREYCYKYG